MKIWLVGTGHRVLSNSAEIRRISLRKLPYGEQVAIVRAETKERAVALYKSGLDPDDACYADDLPEVAELVADGDEVIFATFVGDD